jgi:predicted TIM-barrel fold metal-dependent hydrolase
MRIDVNAFVGDYPFRKLEGTDPAGLLAAMDRVGIDQAWVSSLAAVFWKDPTEANEDLYRAAQAHPALRPVPAIHPGLAHWAEHLARAAGLKAPCVRVDATFYGVHPLGPEMAAVMTRATDLGLPVVMAAKLEDGRQRHPHDATPDLSAATVRGLIRTHPGLRLLITHADRDLIEQVHFGATPDESSRIWWDICWLWGPPMDDFDHLVHTLGAGRFCFGTGMPLRIPESAAAKLDLLRCSDADRDRIDGGNAAALGVS